MMPVTDPPTPVFWKPNNPSSLSIPVHADATANALEHGQGDAQLLACLVGRQVKTGERGGGKTRVRALGLLHLKVCSRVGGMQGQQAVERAPVATPRLTGRQHPPG